MSMYGDYIWERENRYIIEDEQGFATYLYNDELKHCYIVDIYVHPDFRRQNVASKYADQITEVARERGYKTLLGSVDVTTNAATASMKVLLAYGFQLQGTHGNLIFLTKDI